MGGGFVPQHAATPAAAPPGGDGEGIKAPLAGSVARVLVKEGQEIEAGDVLIVLEAMKMETEITAPAGGTVTAVLVSAGDAVTGGQVLVQLGAGSSRCPSSARYGGRQPPSPCSRWPPARRRCWSAPTPPRAGRQRPPLPPRTGTRWAAGR